MTLLLLSWVLCGAALHGHRDDTADRCFCLLLISSIVCSTVAWVHYLVFLVYPLLWVAAEAKATTGRKRARLAALIVMCLISVNLASQPLVTGDHPLLKTVVNAHPLLMMLLLWLHFAFSLRRSSDGDSGDASVGIRKVYTSPNEGSS